MARAVFAMPGAAGAMDRRIFDAAAAGVATRVRAVPIVAASVDRAMCDALATEAARATAAAITAAGRFDIRRFDRAVRGLSGAVLAAGQRTRALQAGRIENHLLAALGWALVVLGVAAFAATTD